VSLPLTGAAGTSIATLLARRRGLRVWAPGLLVTMFLAGVAAYALHRARLPTWDALPPRETRLVLKVERVFVQSDPRRATGLGRVLTAEQHLHDLTGQRVYFSLSLRKGDSLPTRSAVISTVGVLVTLPSSPPADTFDGYLAAAGVNFRLTRGKVSSEVRPARGYYRFCAQAAAAFNEILGRGIVSKRPALAGLLRAMMLGDTHELSDEQHLLFMQSGTMHLFAISGLNIGVVASSLQALLLLVRLPAYARFIVGAALLWLFVDITGAAPSAVRAFAMTVFVQAAFVLWRPANLLAALTASAFVVLLLSPLQVFSASFLMSYAIVAALLMLGLPLGEAWLAHWSPWQLLPKPTWRWSHHLFAYAWRVTVNALAIGLATTLVSLLTGLQFFRLLTPGSLAANLVLIPAAVVVTLGGFASLLCGLIGLGFGAVLCNHAAALVLLVIEWIVQLSVKLPGAFLPARFSAPWIGPVALAALFAVLLAGYATQWRRNRGGWWPPLVIVALVLIFGVQFGNVPPR
jgi:competence protein ComEC